MTLVLTTEAALINYPMLGMKCAPCAMPACHRLFIISVEIYRAPKKLCPPASDHGARAFSNGNNGGGRDQYWRVIFWRPPSAR